MTNSLDRRSLDILTSFGNFLTVAEVATVLKLNEQTIWKWCRDGRLPSYRFGRSYRVSIDQLRGFMDRQEGQA